MKKLRIACLGCLGVIAIVIVCFVILTFTVGRLMNPYSPPRDAAERMEEYLQRDKELFVVVRDYFVSMRYEFGADSISIRWATSTGQRYDGTVFLGSEHGYVAIENEAVSNAIRRLFNNYRAITLRHNYILFQRWSTLDNGWGALYLLEGDEPYSRPGASVTILESLSEDGWYFYRTG